MRFNKLVPELGVRDYKKSLEFYTMLGFKIEYSRGDRDGEHDFAFLSLEGSQLMIDEITDPHSRTDAFQTGRMRYPLGRGMHFQIEVKNLDRIISILSKHNYPLRRPVNTDKFRSGNRWFKVRNILVQDPDGYLLMFHQDA